MPPEFVLRPYRPADAPAAVAVVNAAAARALQSPRAVVDAVGNVRFQRFAPPSREEVVALDDAGILVGYAYLVAKERGVVYETGGAVHPDAWGQGVGAALLEWAEGRARASEGVLEGVRTVLQTNLFEQEEAAVKLVTGQGFVRVRDWLHLRLHLDAPPPPEKLEGVTLRPMDLEADWDAVGGALEAAFADHWGALRSRCAKRRLCLGRARAPRREKARLAALRANPTSWAPASVRRCCSPRA